MKLLIKSLPELRAAVSFSGDILFPRLEPGVRAAQLLLARYVGLPTIELLVADSEALDEDHAELLNYAKIVVGNLAMVQLLATGILTVSNSGAMRTKTANESDAFEWQIERADTGYRTAAYQGLEDLLRYLDGKLTVFTAYAESIAYKARAKQLLPSADLFSQYYEIGSSRLVYQTLLASMRTVEERTIRPMLKSKLAGLLGENLSEEQEAQLTAARRALAYGTIARALRERLISVTDQGVQVLSLQLTRSQHAPSDKQLETSLAYFDSEAGEMLTALVTSLAEPAPDQPASTRPSPIINRAIVGF
jgi:hypothetical protein